MIVMWNWSCSVSQMTSISLVAACVGVAVFDDIGERFVNRHLAVIDGAFVKPGRFSRLDHKIAGVAYFLKTSGNDEAACF